MEISEKKQKIVRGDLLLAGQMVGITRKNAQAALKREGSKYHQRVKDALVKIFAAREALIRESGKQL